MAVFVVQICCHLDDQNRDHTVTRWPSVTGTSQVRISPLLSVHQCVTTETGAGSAFAGCCDIGRGKRSIFTGAKMLREDAFSGGWKRRASAGKNMISSFMRQRGNRGILSFTHAEAQQAEAAGASSTPPDCSSRRAFNRSELFHGHGSVRACVRFFLREATG